jgi:hypothetical protein
MSKRPFIQSKLPGLPAVLALLLGAPACAATLSPSGFSYTGGTPALAGGPVFASWNPNPASNSQVFDQGAHIGFFGHAAGCPASAANGPAGPLDPKQARSLAAADTAFRPAPGATVWSPQPDSDCRGEQGGPAFVAAGKNGGPLQVFTALQPASPGGGGFWGSYPSTGQDQSGANASIEGTFLNWIFNGQPGSAVRPWADGNRAREVTISTTQAVAAAHAEPSSVSVNQVKQQVAVSFFNQACQSAAANKHLCQLRIMFDIDLVRDPSLDWSTQPWAGYARLMFDPAQGGLPVIEGPLLSAGQATTTAGAQGVTLWRSRGAQTQHGTFGSTRFEAKIGFRDLMAGVRLVAQRASNTQGPVDRDTMARLFGPAWNSPQDWTIIGVNIGQEVHGAGDRSTAYIGGEMDDLSIGAGAD